VDLWVTDDAITQIALFQGYRGKVGGKVGLGSRLARIEELWGPIYQNDDDNLVATRLPGWCFEFPDCRELDDPVADLQVRVHEIYVYATLL
jgi:hypothetical protein